MSQFVSLSGLSQDAHVRTIDIEAMARHYLIAALWADCPEGTNPRVTNQAREMARKTCTRFADLIRPELWAQILECPGYWGHPDCTGMPEAAIGHDLYLTSAGHGVGVDVYWEGEPIICAHSGRLIESAYGVPE